MKLGLASAILPDMTLEHLFRFAADEGLDCLELMCWPTGKAERRYAGVTHIDVANLTLSKVHEVNDLRRSYGVEISALGYYPNVLSADQDEAARSAAHLTRVIDAAASLEVPCVTTFIGRDQHKTVDENWPAFERVWAPLLERATYAGVKIGIENCPMLFTEDEWPGGKNLATSPAIWRRMFATFPAARFGLNFDPSHFVWQGMDTCAAIREFGPRLHHIHAKDARIDRGGLAEHGTMGYPNRYHTPKLPGMGEVAWGSFFGALTDAGYTGAVCIEVEDRAYEATPADRKRAVRQSIWFLRQYIPRS
jgi:sugar phosphate isomerase/epimerase